MHQSLQSIARLSLLLPTLALSAVPSQAAYPDKPIRLIVTFVPGGAADLLGRYIAKALTAELGQPVVVENRTGAGGLIGIEAGRSADRRPLSILDSPLKDDAAITYGETLEDHKATVEARILAKERITELKPMIDELNEYLATQPPRVALIHQMACSGIARNEISTILADKHGIEASPDLVAQIITRNLRKRFPDLAFLWEKKSKQSS